MKRFITSSGLEWIGYVILQNSHIFFDLDSVFISFTEKGGNVQLLTFYAPFDIVSPCGKSYSLHYFRSCDYSYGELDHLPAILQEAKRFLDSGSWIHVEHNKTPLNNLIYLLSQHIECS